jgi:replicative superfamily II helicase
MKTTEFKYVRLPFDEFNPPQVEAIKFAEQDCNLIVALNTATGKTAVAMCFFAHELMTNDTSKCVYASPLKAISQERITQFNEVEEWKDFPKVINTGDHFAAPDDFQNARIVILTSETLDSKARNSDLHGVWLKEVGVLVIDELHLLGDVSRGTALEAGLINFTTINQKARLVGLSATMSNAKEIATWFKSLNGKSTYVVSSDWRPVELRMHWVPVPLRLNRWQSEQDVLDAAVRIVEQHHDDKTLLFVHSKRLGRELVRELDRCSCKCEFYHAGLEKSRRLVLEELFRNKVSGLNTLITTSALAMGVNL